MPAVPAAPFGDLLRHHRLTLGLSQVELARRAQLSVRAISDLERGIRRAPQPHTLQQLAGALGLNAAERARLAAASCCAGTLILRPKVSPTSRCGVQPVLEDTEAQLPGRSTVSRRRGGTLGRR